jgi:hypothetical protein
MRSRQEIPFGSLGAFAGGPEQAIALLIRRFKDGYVKTQALARRARSPTSAIGASPLA